MGNNSRTLVLCEAGAYSVILMATVIAAPLVRYRRLTGLWGVMRRPTIGLFIMHDTPRGTSEGHKRTDNQIKSNSF